MHRRGLVVQCAPRSVVSINADVTGSVETTAAIVRPSGLTASAVWSGSRSCRCHVVPSSVQARTDLLEAVSPSTHRRPVPSSALTVPSGLSTFGEAMRLLDRADERLLHGVLGLAEAAAERVELGDQPTVATVVQLTQAFLTPPQTATNLCPHD
ncbi:hypothetical protein OG817_30480 [Kribbella sp. NBC_00889]|nr:hypothetical protein OG817_30480 [Kribbella sp. NBC_00889]